MKQLALDTIEESSHNLKEESPYYLKVDNLEKYLSEISPVPLENSALDLNNSLNFKISDQKPFEILLDKNIYYFDSFIAFQKWDGVVLKIEDGYFYARLTDLINLGIEEEAEFLIDEISKQDLFLLKEGACFYWSIGYLDRISGQRIRSSVIRFKRVPAWTEKEIEKAKTQADEFLNGIDFE